MKPLKNFLPAASIPSTINQSSTTVARTSNSGDAYDSSRRILHQPLFPAAPPPPPTQATPTEEHNWTFFHHPPPPPSTDQSGMPIIPTNANTPLRPPIQPAHPAETFTIVLSISIAMVLMLSALSIFLCQCLMKRRVQSSKHFGSQPEQGQQEASTATSSSIHNGPEDPNTSEPSLRASHHDLNSVRMPEPNHPSPILQPMPPLKLPSYRAAPPNPPSDDEETSFYTPWSSDVVDSENSFSPALRPIFPATIIPMHHSELATPIHGVSLRDQLSDSTTSPEPAITPPLHSPMHMQQFQLQNSAEILSPSDGNEEFPAPSSPSSELMLPPLANDAVPPAERCSDQQEILSETVVSVGPDQKLSRPHFRKKEKMVGRPPSLSMWISAPLPVVDDNHGGSSSKPVYEMKNMDFDKPNSSSVHKT